METQIGLTEDRDIYRVPVLGYSQPGRDEGLSSRLRNKAICIKTHVLYATTVKFHASPKHAHTF